MPEIKLIETNNSITNCSTLHSNSLQNFRLQSLIFTKIYKFKHTIFGVHTFCIMHYKVDLKIGTISSISGGKTKILVYLYKYYKIADDGTNKWDKIDKG